MMTKAQIEARVDGMVDDLFTNGNDARADRLVLIKGTLDIGGWCREAVRDRLLKLVKQCTERTKS